MKKTSFIRVGLLMVLMLLMLSLWQVQALEICWNTNPTPLPTPNAPYHSAVVLNGKIYVIGGTNISSHTEKVFFADINLDGTVGSWTTTTPLPEPRSGDALVWNNFVYVVGGYGPPWGGRSQQNTVFYASINADGTIGEWRTTTTLPERISHFAAVVWNGRVYVMGGNDGYGYRNEVYFAQINSDGSLGDWHTTTPLPQQYCGMSGLAYDGMVYVIGGIHAYDQCLRCVYKASINQDGTLGDWQEALPLPEGRAYAGVALSGENVYVVGGSGPIGSDFRKTVYRANVQILNWQEIYESLPEQRQSHSLVVFQDRLYVIGGDAGLSDGHPIRKDTIYYSSLPKVPATVDIDPNTLNLKSNGEWITCYIELSVGFNVGDIDASTILLNGTIGVDLGAPTQIGDHDCDGIADLMVKFDRSTVIDWLRLADYSQDTGKSFEVNLRITGTVAGTPFEGADTVKVLLKG